eukprot:1301253-Rhodomonas_salina.1
MTAAPPVSAPSVRSPSACSQPAQHLPLFHLLRVLRSCRAETVNVIELSGISNELKVGGGESIWAACDRSP